MACVGIENPTFHSESTKNEAKDSSACLLTKSHFHTLKSKTLGPKSFSEKTSDKKLLDTFSGISDKLTFGQNLVRKFDRPKVFDFNVIRIGSLK